MRVLAMRFAKDGFSLVKTKACGNREPLQVHRPFLEYPIVGLIRLLFWDLGASRRLTVAHLGLGLLFFRAAPPVIYNRRPSR